MSYFIDVQGTLIDDKDKKPINGSIEFIQKLNKKKIPYVVVTNNTKKQSREFYSFLINLGFEIPEKNYLDPFMVLDKVLLEKEVFCFGPNEFSNTISSLGYVKNERDPKAILVASSKEFNSSDFASMIEYAMQGVQLIGMHATSIYAKDSKRYPGVGAIMQMISYASGKEFDIIGKPSDVFYKEALRLLNKQKSGLKFSDVIMISDDAIGDLHGVKNLGAKTVLVLSGKCKSEDEVLHIKDSIDEIAQNIGAIK